MGLNSRIRRLLLRLGLPLALVAVGALTQAVWDWSAGAWMALIGLAAICAQAFYAVFIADIASDISEG